MRSTAAEESTLVELIETITQVPNDKEAWEKLYRMLWPTVFGTLFRAFRGERERAEEGTQEVMIRLFKYTTTHHLQPHPRALLALVSAICHSVEIDTIRRRLRSGESAMVRACVTSDSDRQSSGQSPEAGNVAVEMYRALRSHLNERESTLADLLRVGHSPAEVARELNLTVKAVYARRERLRRRVREILQDLVTT